MPAQPVEAAKRPLVRTGLKPHATELRPLKGGFRNSAFIPQHWLWYRPPGSSVEKTLSRTPSRGCPPRCDAIACVGCSPGLEPGRDRVRHTPQ